MGVFGRKPRKQEPAERPDPRDLILTTLKIGRLYEVAEVQLAGEYSSTFETYSKKLGYLVNLVVADIVVIYFDQTGELLKRGDFVPERLDVPDEIDLDYVSTFVKEIDGYVDQIVAMFAEADPAVVEELESRTTMLRHYVTVIQNALAVRDSGFRVVTEEIGVDKSDYGTRSYI